MKVTSTKSVHFPKLNWGINAGEIRDLPEDKAAQERILQCQCISEAKDNAGKTGAPINSGESKQITDKPKN